MALSDRTSQTPSAFIFHHTGGRGNTEGVQATLNQRGLGVQYIMDRDGNITPFSGPGASHMRPGSGVGAGLSNANTVGMEVIARNNGDVTPQQVAAAQAFIAKNYPNTPVYGHGEVNPGHKEADEGLAIVNAIRAGQPRPPAPIPQQAAPQFPMGAMAQAPQAGGGGPMPLFSPQQAPTTNLDAAHAALNLTPQERALYERHLTNLYGPGGADNPDGSRSTLYQAVQQNGGRFYNIPTVWDGKREAVPWTNPKTGQTMDVPNATALANVGRVGWDKFPSYATPDEAEARYQKMHDFMERDTGAYMQQRQAPQTQPTQKPAGGPLDLMALIGQGGAQPQSLPPLFAPQSQPAQQAPQPQAPQSFFASLPAGPQQMAGDDLARWWGRQTPWG